MKSKRSLAILTTVSRWARSTGMLQNHWTRGAFVSSYFLYKRFFEDPFWGLISRRPDLFAGGDVLDIGANIGYTSFLFARVLSPGSKVYSFEPDRVTFRLLLDVIQRKNLSEKVVAFNLAVGSSEGKIDFWHNEQHSADHRVATPQFRKFLEGSAQISTISLTSIDSFVSAHKLRNLSFIKMDVQGYELAVCEGMRQTLANFPDLTVGVEYAPESLTDLGFDPPALLNFFRANNYRLHILTRSRLQLARENATIAESVARAGYVDLLCSRKELASP